MTDEALRLHLGCGEKYLEGYVNIDFPLSEHTVQRASVADVHADILALRYPPGSVGEVRLHHVFEHFARPVACALLAGWHSWLQPSGTLRLEVPDFEAMARKILGRFTLSRRRMRAERHIFGSQEAPWAVHYSGYTEKGLKHFLEQFGFRIDVCRRNSWKGTANIEMIARKGNGTYSRADFTRVAERYLSGFLVDRSKGERTLLATWVRLYEEQVSRTWGEAAGTTGL